MAFPGGFSFGDDLGSGQVLDLKISLQLGDELREFVHAKKPVIGICNGFSGAHDSGSYPNLSAFARWRSLATRAATSLNRWVGWKPRRIPYASGPRTSPKTAPRLDCRRATAKARVVFRKGEEEVIHRTLAQAGQIALRYDSE